MALMPNSLSAKIQFVEAHLGDWQTNAVAIGSSAPEIAALVTKTETARDALTAQQTAQDTAKTKTAILHDAVDAMVTATSDLIKKVRAKAATDGDEIYQLANIPAPASPSNRPAPGVPSDFEAQLGGDGSLKILWKCANPVGTSGTWYRVYRSIDGSTDFKYLGDAGVREYVDATIAAGVTQVTYKIQAARTTGAGGWATFNVFFGTNASGATTATLSNAPKMAA